MTWFTGLVWGIKYFFFVSGWISVSVSVSEFYTVEVQTGEQVTLKCTNYSSAVSHIHWSRLTSRSNITCISSMSSSDGNASFCDGFENGRFDMTSNITTLFLQIKQVDLSDSGLYICGAKCNDKPLIDSATYLKVQGKILMFCLWFGWTETDMCLS